MNKTEAQSFLADTHQGLIFGKNRISLSDSYTNLGLIAPTGSGKTTKFVIPNILQCTGSIVVTDPSGEIFRYTSGYMQKRGYKIKKLQLTDVTNSDQFNPLKRFRTHQQLRQLATTLVIASGSEDPFWSKNATDVLYIGLVALVRVGRC